MHRWSKAFPREAERELPGLGRPKEASRVFLMLP